MNGFEVERVDRDLVSCLYLKGFLDAHTAPKFEQALQQLVDESRYKIVVNLQDLSYISSARLGVFMGFIEDVRSSDGDIKMTNMTTKVFKVFDLLGFPNLYEIFDKEDQALNEFTKRKEG